MSQLALRLPAVPFGLVPRATRTRTPQARYKGKSEVLRSLRHYLQTQKPRTLCNRSTTEEYETEKVGLLYLPCFLRLFTPTARPVTAVDHSGVLLFVTSIARNTVRGCTHGRVWVLTRITGESVTVESFGLCYICVASLEH